MSVNRKQIAGIFLTVTIAFSLACAPQAAPTSQAQPSPVPAAALAPAPAPAVVPIVPAKPAWQLEWEKAEALAKSEGRLVLLTSISPEGRRTITDAFKSKYGIIVELVGGQPAILAAKISAEQRAGIYSSDIWITGTSQAAVLPLTDRIDPALILPDVTDTEVIKKTWFFGELYFPGQDHKTLTSGMILYQPITVNTTLVKPDEITTYADLLNPKWKGKISLNDPRISAGGGPLWFSSALELKDVDASYMRELLKQELFISRDTRLQVEWLAQGKHAVAIAPLTSAVAEFIRLGSPLRPVGLGTPFTTGGTSGIYLLKRAPHPGATSLFLNWLLSQEGQTLHSRAIGAQSQRLDVPTEHLNPSVVLKPGVKLFRADSEAFVTKRNTFYAELAKEVFGP